MIMVSKRGVLYVSVSKIVYDLLRISRLLSNSHIVEILSHHRQSSRSNRGGDAAQSANKIGSRLLAANGQGVARGDSGKLIPFLMGVIIKDSP